MASRKTSGGSKWAIGCLLLFALPFAAVGVAATLWSGYVALRHAAMQSWVEAPATIKSAKLDSHSGSEGGSTYKAVATYEYEFGGRKYSGDRVSIGGGSDNIGQFQRNAYDELKVHLDQRNPFRCYVDPENPRDAVLYRNLRGEMLTFYTMFATLFGSVGLGLMSGALVGSRYMQAWKTEDVPTDQPWLARSDWAAGQIPSSSGAAAPVMAVVPLYWNIASLPLLLNLPEVFREGHGFWAWLALVFPILGGALVCALVYQVIRARKFGESVLQLASTPGVVGGQLAGVVRISKPVVATDGFHLLLTCVKRQTSGDDSREVAIWQDERVLMETMQDGSGGTAVPVLFAIPYTCEETTPPNSERDVKWQLEVSAKTTGVDYKSQFELPVFKTSDSRADFALDERLAAAYAGPPNQDVLLNQAGIFRESLAAGGVRLVFPAARNLGSALVVTAFFAIWMGAIWVMLSVGTPWFIPLICGIFGLIMLWMVLDLWFFRSVVEVDRHCLIVRSGLLGIGRRRTFAVEDIKHFSTTEYMSSGANVWNNIVIVPRTGPRRTIAKGISSKLAQQAVIDELNVALGRRDT